MLLLLFLTKLYNFSHHNPHVCPNFGSVWKKLHSLTTSLTIHYLYFLNASVTLCPPNPKELDSATSTIAERLTWGT
jgi:hypothetical protein